MKVSEIYNYENADFAPLRDPMRGVIAAYQDAARFLDTVQENVYINMGMIHTSRVIHDLAHEMPKRFDEFGDALHEQHLMVEYPATNELAEDIKELDEAFAIVVEVLNNVGAALERFREVTDNARFRPLALKAEEMMMKNSADYTRILEMWAMWENGKSSATSFDNWVMEMY